MFEIQKYLQSGKTFDDLEKELGIYATFHPEQPLVILNYDQIESKKTDPVVRECRGLVLHSKTFEIVAKGFNRFFNWGEVMEEMDRFDFSDFTVTSKEDGSYIAIYNFEDRWYANTRASFGLGEVDYSSFTWQGLVCKALNINDLQEINLPKHLTYICELVSPYNKVVRTYKDVGLYLLAVFDKGKEIVFDSKLFKKPTVYQYGSIDEIKTFLDEQAKNDPTFEGVVIRDKNGLRFKCKSVTYLSLHRLKGDNCLFHPKHLLPFILAGDMDELITYYPEVKEHLYYYKAQIMEQYAHMLEVWCDAKQLESQKEFALAILKKTPYTGVLFEARKQNADSKAIRRLWKENPEGILKNLSKFA